MKSIREIKIIKDSYIKYLQEKDGCLIMFNEWIFIKNEENIVKECFLKINGIDFLGEKIEASININVINEWNINKIK